MRFNSHSRLAGSHSFLSPSNYHWVNDDDEKMNSRIFASFQARRGTALHELAHQLITLGVKLPDTEETLNAYVNDSIGFRLSPEQILRYSDNCYGCADVIGFRNNKLRIFDLKTGTSPTSVMQLVVYAAIFCLEYGYKPTEIEMEFRIYQNDDVRKYEGNPLDVARVMSQIVVYDKRIDELRMEVDG